MDRNLKYALWGARLALFIVFFWFGILKVFGVSPATGLVKDLLQMTLPFIPAAGFVIFLGLWESLIGILFLFPKATKWAFWLMIVQMFTTFGPLVFLPSATWQRFLFVPTLEGQYIIKNVVLLALGYMIFVLNSGHKNK